MKCSEVLKNAANRIRSKKNWQRGAMVNSHNERVCAVGALYLAIDPRAFDAEKRGSSASSIFGAKKGRIFNKVFLLVDRIAIRDYGSGIFRTNDKKGHTAVVDVLDKATKIVERWGF